ncbi:MAG: hypothetical protein DRN20_05615 [Thermoplasmata archaeon]|nr:MAG: hypothetical protein DRN20_05615 [Thermoplasmata archaeon]
MDNNAQTSVIGTVMAIMVVLAFMALITEQYVPLSMTDYEAEHMREVENQLSVLKQQIDFEIANEEKTMSLYSPISLGSRYVPVFTSPTGGVLNFIPYRANDTSISYMEISFNWSGHVESFRAGGSIFVDIYNRYYVRQNLSYEMGAIVLGQPPRSTDQVVKANPHIFMENSSGYYRLSITLISLMGENYSASGTRTIGVSTNLLSVDSWTYYNASSITLTVSSPKYSYAWYKCLEKTFNGTSPPNTQITIHGGKIVISIPQVDELNIKWAYINIMIGKSRR